MKKLILILMITAFFPLKSFAANESGGISIPLSAMFLLESYNSSGTVSTSNRLLFNGSFGYVLAPALLFLGGTLDYDDISGTGSTAITNMTGYGATVGISNSGISLLVTYYMSEVLAFRSGINNGTSFQGGTGFGAKLSYLFDMGGGKLFIGPSINYKTLRWTTSSTGAIDFTYNSFLPYLTFNIML
jgi:hypothetical protein